MRSQTLFSRRSRMKKCIIYWKVQWYNLFCPRGLGHDTRVTQSSHSILPCGALYKLDPLETKGLNLVRFSKGCVHKHFSVAVVEWNKCIIYWKVQWICFALGGWAMILELRNHCILFCPAGLYIIGPSRNKGTQLSSVFKGMRSQTLFSRRNRMIIRYYVIKTKNRYS